MSMQSEYLLSVLERCSEHSFGQDAIEHAITTGSIILTYDLDKDVQAVCARYDAIVTDYQQFCHNHPRAETAFVSSNRSTLVSRQTDERRKSVGGSNDSRTVGVRAEGERMAGVAARSKRADVQSAK